MATTLTTPTTLETPATRVAELRTLAKTDLGAAQHCAWALIEEAGRRGDVTELDDLFATGTPPRDLDGPYDGMIVHIATPLLGDSLIETLVSQGWRGKTFNAVDACGENRISLLGRLAFNLGWPVYRGIHRHGTAHAGFQFKTSVGPSIAFPDVIVLNIDYVSENPPLIRRLHDELVELVPGVYFGTGFYKGVDQPIAYWAVNEPFEAR